MHEQATSPSPAQDCFQALYEHAANAILLTAPDGRCLAANPAACRLLGYDEAQLCALGREGVVDPEDTRLAAAIAERQRRGTFQAELTLVRGDGTRFEAAISTQLFGPPGAPRAVMTIQDLTERQRLQQEIAERTAQLERQRALDALKDHLLASIAHEIRAPLAQIEGFAELLAERHPDDDLLDGLLEGSRRLARHLDQVHTYAQLVSGQVELSPMAVTPGDAVARAIAAVATRHPASGIRWRVALPALPPVAADPQHLGEMLSTLLEHAVAASPAGAEVAVTGAVGPDSVRLTVHDAGTPISDPERLWEPFAGRDGLGLAMLRLLAELHGGRAGLEAGTEAGNALYLELPTPLDA